MLENLYTAETISKDSDNFKAIVTLNSDHKIFRAHFPGNPVTPGVCLLQISKELIEKHTGRKLFIRTIRNIKFLKAVNPLEFNLLQFHCEVSHEMQTIHSSINIKNGEISFVKISAAFEITG